VRILDIVLLSPNSELTTLIERHECLLSWIGHRLVTESSVHLLLYLLQPFISLVSELFSPHVEVFIPLCLQPLRNKLGLEWALDLMFLVELFLKVFSFRILYLLEGPSALQKLLETGL